MNKCIGKLVFVESTGKSNYYNGEYICINQTENNLYCVNPIGGYDSHSIKILPLIGEDSYKIINISENKEFILNVAKELERFSESKEKRWVESVYTGAKNTARKIRESIDCTEPKKEKENVNVLVEKLLIANMEELTLTNYKALNELVKQL